MTIQEIYAINPEIKNIISVAKKLPNPNFQTYQRFKAIIRTKVGFESNDPKLNTARAYEVVIGELSKALKF
jgi:hypothetical protein